MDISQFKIKFIDEATTLLTKLDNTLIAIEKDASSKENIQEAFRIMHTIKGAGGMFGCDKIVEFTHELETIYDIIRTHSYRVETDVIEITFASIDHIRILLQDENLEQPINAKNHAELLKEIESIKNNLNENKPSTEVKQIKKTPHEVNFSTWNILFYLDDELTKRAINVFFTFQDLFHLGEYKINQTTFKTNDVQFWSIFLITQKSYDEIEDALIFVMDYCKINKIADYNIFDKNQLNLHKEQSSKGITINELTSGLANEASKSLKRNLNPETKKTIKTQETISNFNKAKTNRINVDAEKLDTLMFLVSELVTTKSELILDLQRQDWDKAIDVAEKIERLSKLFSENALSIRLVSMHEMVGRFNRLIRDIGKQLDKNILFHTSGEETELDKNILDNLGEPLMHLVRNCIDHGIESPEVRKNRGKSPVGVVSLNAWKTGNYVHITISDDGNGIDTNFIYKKAIEKGFIHNGAHLSDKEIYDLIFLPGFSTAKSLTNISGRGVGMDIVLKKIQEIRGEISIESELGKGTTFSIKLQQTISIIETLLVVADKDTFAIPIEDIETCLIETEGKSIKKQSNLLEFNDLLIPYIDLREGFSEKRMNQSPIEKLLIIHKNEKKYAIIIDNIIGEYQAVIKPLGSAFKSVDFLSGTSLLGDGGIALLLDTDKLWHEIDHINNN